MGAHARGKCDVKCVWKVCVHKHLSRFKPRERKRHAMRWRAALGAAPLYLVRISRARCISTTAARSLLGLPEVFTPRQLRDAYFEAARSSHPDAVCDADADDDAPLASARSFIAVSEAYEKLRGVPGEHDPSVVTGSEEDEFRSLCLVELGVTADAVEEAKRCPMFRIWLQNSSRNNDYANHWRRFLAMNGGLAPRLAPRTMLSSGGAGASAGPRRRIVRKTRRL